METALLEDESAAGEEAVSPVSPLDLDPPRAPLRGNLLLTGSQERQLELLIEQRIKASVSSCYGDKWLEDRRIATAHYGGDFSNRRIPGTIFAHSNISLNLPKRYIRITAAKVFDELLSSNPLISVGPEGEEDSSIEAQTIQRLLAAKFEEAGLRDVLLEAGTAAGIRGEGAVKSGWVKRSRRARKRCRLLLGQGGEPVRARDGNLVTDKDSFLPDPEKSGAHYLAKDKKIRIEGEPQWSEEQLVPFHHVVYEGLEACLIDYRDFLCNTSERCIHSADFVAIKLDIPVDDVGKMLSTVRDTPQGQEYLNLLKNTADQQAGAEAAKADLTQGETERTMESVPLANMAEVYLRLTVDPDGDTDEVACLYDTKNNRLVAYDYLCNISKTYWRPIRIVRIEPLEGRWHGVGFYKLFSDRHKFVDLFFNRVNFRSSMAGAIKFENPYATEEGMAGEPIQPGTNKTYRLREGYTKEDAYGVFVPQDDSASAQNLLNMLLQVTQLEAGMVSAGDQGLAGLPASDLATGIKSLERVANVLQKLIFHHLIRGFEEILMDCAKLVLGNITTYEVERLMGEEAAKIIDRCRDLDGLKYKVKLVLSMAKDSDTLKSNELAAKMTVDYNQMPPELQRRVRYIYLKIFKTLGIEDAEKALPMPQESTPPAPPPANEPVPATT